MQESLSVLLPFHGQRPDTQQKKPVKDSDWQWR